MPREMLEKSLGVRDVSAYFQAVATQLGPALPADALVTFELLGEGGGVWTLHKRAEGLRVRAGRGVWADSTLTCSLARFIDLVTGRIDVNQAFFDGTVRVEGDVGLLVRLHKALPQAA